MALAESFAPLEKLYRDLQLRIPISAATSASYARVFLLPERALAEA
jgi:hypothetical protein